MWHANTTHYCICTSAVIYIYLVSMVNINHCHSLHLRGTDAVMCRVRVSHKVFLEKQYRVRHHVSLGWLWFLLFQHLAQLLSHFCQFPISPSKGWNIQNRSQPNQGPRRRDVIPHPVGTWYTLTPHGSAFCIPRISDADREASADTLTPTEVGKQREN